MSVSIRLWCKEINHKVGEKKKTETETETEREREKERERERFSEGEN